MSRLTSFPDSLSSLQPPLSASDRQSGAIEGVDSSVEPQMVDFISDYFQEFTNSLGLDAADGSGLENLASQPYVLSTDIPILTPTPAPAPTSIPESSSVEAVLILAACFGFGAVLKRLRYGSVKSK